MTERAKILLPVMLTSMFLVAFMTHAMGWTSLLVFAIVLAIIYLWSLTQ